MSNFLGNKTSNNIYNMSDNTNHILASADFFNYFPDAHLLKKYNNLLYDFDIPISDLEKIMRWKRNRPTDDDKVNQIVSSLNSDSVVFTLPLLIAHIKIDSKSFYYCYDGCNRREALLKYKNMDKENSKLYININILFNSNHDVIEKRFKDFNKLTPVPDIYTNCGSKDITVELSKQIEDIVEIFCKKYKALQTQSNNPQRPNFNKTSLNNDLLNWAKERGYNTIDKEEFFNNLSILNDKCKSEELYLHSSQAIRSKKYALKDAVKNKCDKYNCWFLSTKEWLNTLL